MWQNKWFNTINAVKVSLHCNSNSNNSSKSGQKLFFANFRNDDEYQLQLHIWYVYSKGFHGALQSITFYMNWAKINRGVKSINNLNLSLSRLTSLCWDICVYVQVSIEGKLLGKSTIYNFFTGWAVIESPKSLSAAVCSKVAFVSNLAFEYWHFLLFCFMKYAQIYFCVCGINGLQLRH